ncbi:MAG TPA: BBP7 family outer membrane beta-barrel protein [Pirellulales bacterium]|nr:BBP7 family outer membrane beta-barrel protein [Pirellulales bacterium]
MERNFLQSWLVGMAVLLGGAGVAWAQEPPPQRMPAEDNNQTGEYLQIQPIGPVQQGNVADAQFFRPPDLTNIGNYPEPNYGPFFQYERLYWSLHQPSTTVIGDPATAAGFGSVNDLDTGFMKARFVWGNRFDIGYMQDDDKGWLTSILKTNTQFNTLNSATPTTVFFIDNEPAFGGASTAQFVENSTPTYSSIIVSNTTRMTGIELMRTLRYAVSHDGGVWTFMYGARFFQLHDRYDIEAETLGGDVTVSATETLETTAAPNSYDLGINNNVVGPQIGLSWQHEDDRVVIGADLRAMIGANFQEATLFGYSGSGSTDVVTGVGAQTVGIGIPNQPLDTFHGTKDNVTFAPLGELRLNAQYKVTSNVSLTAGYTALLVTGVGRAANRLEYVLPDSGISNGADKEHFFANGINVGIEVNR